MYMMEHLYGDFELRIEQKSSDLFSGKSFGHLHTREAVVTLHIPVRQTSLTLCLFQESSISRATMYSEWSSLTVQLQTLGTATQSVLSKLPPEDGKQVGDK